VPSPSRRFTFHPYGRFRRPCIRNLDVKEFSADSLLYCSQGKLNFFDVNCCTVDEICCPPKVCFSPFFLISCVKFVQDFNQTWDVQNAQTSILGSSTRNGKQTFTHMSRHDSSQCPTGIGFRIFEGSNLALKLEIKSFVRGTDIHLTLHR